MDRRRILETVVVRAAIICLGLGFSLGLAEAALRSYLWWLSRSHPAIHRLCGDCKRLYELVPGAPEINSLGFRGSELPVGAGLSRRPVVVLGDSVTFGPWVEASETFAAQLQHSLQDAGIGVLNAGVAGYSIYNELYALKERIIALDPRLIVLQVCLNDISDPRYHLNAVSKVRIDIPADAIPNPDAVERLGVPLTIRLLRSPWLRWSALAQQNLNLAYRRRFDEIRDGVGVSVNGRWWPTYITAELPLDLHPWLDAASPERRWYESNFRQLAAVLREHAVPLVVLYIPLAYQLDAGYPFTPQDGFRTLTASVGGRFVDVLPELARYGKEEVYVSAKTGGLDMWHLSARGHSVVADMLLPVVTDALADGTQRGEGGS